jgi:hypothetical protein
VGLCRRRTQIGLTDTRDTLRSFGPALASFQLPDNAFHHPCTNERFPVQTTTAHPSRDASQPSRLLVDFAATASFKQSTPDILSSATMADHQTTAASRAAASGSNVRCDFSLRGGLGSSKSLTTPNFRYAQLDLGTSPDRPGLPSTRQRQRQLLKLHRRGFRATRRAGCLGEPQPSPVAAAALAVHSGTPAPTGEVSCLKAAAYYKWLANVGTRGYV